MLDKYDQPLKNEIASARSLDELVRRYDPVRKQVDAAKEQAKSEEKPVNEYSNLEPYKQKPLREPFRIELARTILSKRFGAKRPIRGECIAARPVHAERRDAGLVELARTILLKRFGAKRQKLWIGIAED